MFKEHMVKRGKALAAEQEAERIGVLRQKSRPRCVAYGGRQSRPRPTTALQAGRRYAPRPWRGLQNNMNASATRTGNLTQKRSNQPRRRALATAQTVASAAEQLAASIREVGGQMAKSTEIVGRAVDCWGRNPRHH